MDAQMQARRAMEYDLRKALAAGEFELHYQPVVNLASNEISGFEALIRWHHPEKGMIPPGAFIPLAEEIGLIVPIGEWVLREACATAARWPGTSDVAVNISPAQFRDPALVQVVVERARRLGPCRPTGWSSKSPKPRCCRTARRRCDAASAPGARRAHRQRTTSAPGYSSLSHLQSFPFDKIKIDRSFVEEHRRRCAGSLNIVRAVAALASGLGIPATAEGVENRSSSQDQVGGLHRDAGLPDEQASAGARGHSDAACSARAIQGGIISSIQKHPMTAHQKANAHVPLRILVADDDPIFAT